MIPGLESDLAQLVSLLLVKSFLDGLREKNTDFPFSDVIRNH